MGRTYTYESEACSGPADLAEAMPNRQEGQRLMAKVTQPAKQRHQPALPQMTRAEALAEAARVLEQLGITAAVLHLAERTDCCSANQADVTEAPAGAS